MFLASWLLQSYPLHLEHPFMEMLMLPVPLSTNYSAQLWEQQKPRLQERKSGGLNRTGPGRKHLRRSHTSQRKQSSSPSPFPFPLLPPPPSFSLFYLELEGGEPMGLNRFSYRKGLPTEAWALDRQRKCLFPASISQ